MKSTWAKKSASFLGAFLMLGVVVPISLPSAVMPAASAAVGAADPVPPPQPDQMPDQMPDPVAGSSAGLAADVSPDSGNPANGVGGNGGGGGGVTGDPPSDVEYTVGDDPAFTVVGNTVNLGANCRNEASPRPYGDTLYLDNPHTVCDGSGFGTVYKAFPNMGVNGPGNTYVQDEELPWAVRLVVNPVEYTSFCTVPKTKTEPNPAYINDIQTPNVPKTIEVPDGVKTTDCKASTPKGDFLLRAQKRLSQDRGWPEYDAPDIHGDVCSTLIDNYGARFNKDGGIPLTANYIGYKVDWGFSLSADRDYTGEGMGLSGYDCAEPPRPIAQKAVCYRTLHSYTNAYIPDPRAKGPSTEPGVKVFHTAGTPYYTIKPDDQITAYGKVAPPASSGANYSGILSTCTAERNALRWDYDKDFQKTDWGFDRPEGKWAWGTYESFLSADYDRISYVRFGYDAFFGTTFPPYIQWDKSSLWTNNHNQVASWDRLPDGDAGKWWRSKVYLYCSNGDDTAPHGVAWQGWWYGRAYWARDYDGQKKIVPGGLKYTGDDCAPPPETCQDGECDSVALEAAAWFCPGGQLLAYGLPGGQTVLRPGTDFVQGQADNLGRDLTWNTFNPQSSPLQPKVTLKDVKDRKIVYTASDDSSPRLKDSDPNIPQSGQPFTMTPQLNDDVIDWTAESRTLKTQFREASRSGKAFTVTPTFKFTADLLQKSQMLRNYNVSNGSYSITYGDEWLNDYPLTCTGTTTDIEVLRVGVAPN